MFSEGNSSHVLFYWLITLITMSMKIYDCKLYNQETFSDAITAIKLCISSFGFSMAVAIKGMG